MITLLKLELEKILRAKSLYLSFVVLSAFVALMLWGFYSYAARKTGGRRSSSGPGRTTRGGADKAQLAQMREWGKANGYKVSDRGRVSAELQEAYHQAN